jgi:hypothetical protein
MAEAEKEKRVWSFQQKNKKKNYNPKSRNNLKQYSAPANKAKQNKIVKSLLEEVEIEVDPEILETIIPADDIFTPKEKERFLGFLRLYMNQFGKDTVLSISDIDDISQLCMNRIMEVRLYAKVKSGDQQLPDITSALEKYKKDTAKLKEQLAANRSVRIDPRAARDVTVLDVLYDYDSEASDAHENEILERLQEEEEKVAGKAKTSLEEMII